MTDADAPVPDLVFDILDLVEAIPPGRVMTYGDVAGVVGRGGPRQVGTAMARWGGAVPWHNRPVDSQRPRTRSCRIERGRAAGRTVVTASCQR